jgi:hypothetical protein
MKIIIYEHQLQYILNEDYSIMLTKNLIMEYLFKKNKIKNNLEPIKPIIKTGKPKNFKW